MKNPYDILKLDKTADTKEIKRAYARLIREYPPETHPEEFKEIRKAYEMLASKNLPEIEDEIIPNSFSEPIYTFDSEIQLPPYEEYEDTPPESEVTPESDFKFVLNLFSSYVQTGYYETAVDVLNSAIDRDNRGRSTNIIYYFELIKFFSSIKDLKNFSLTLDELLKFEVNEENVKLSDYITDNLEQMAHEFYNHKRFSYSEAIFSKLLQIYPQSVYYRDQSGKSKKIFRYRDMLIKDKNICNCIKELINLLLNEELDEATRDFELKKAYSTIENYDRRKIIKSLRLLFSNYNCLYNLNSRYFLELKERLIKKSPIYYCLSAASSVRPYLVVILAIIGFIYLAKVSPGSTSKLNAIPSSGGDYQQMVLSLNRNSSFNFRLPYTLPNGYELKKAAIKSSIIANELQSTNLRVIEQRLQNDKGINYLFLNFARGDSRINFEASYVTSDALLDFLNSKNTSQITLLHSSATYFEDRSEKGFVIVQQTPGTGQPNDSKPETYILYKIYADYSDSCTKEDFITISNGLK